MKILQAEEGGLAKMPFYRPFERKLELSQEKHVLMHRFFDSGVWQAGGDIFRYDPVKR